MLNNRYTSYTIIIIIIQFLFTLSLGQELTKKEKIELVRSLHAHPPKLSYRLPFADDRSFGPLSSTRDDEHAPSSRHRYLRHVIT